MNKSFFLLTLTFVLIFKGEMRAQTENNINDFVTKINNYLSEISANTSDIAK